MVSLNVGVSTTVSVDVIEANGDDGNNLFSRLNNKTGVNFSVQFDVERNVNNGMEDLNEYSNCRETDHRNKANATNILEPAT